MSETHTELRFGFQSLLELAWPVVLARSSQAVIGFCDALMSAPLGEAPLAAVTTSSINIHAVTILPMGIVFIAQSFAAQLFGQGRTATAIRYAWYALILAGVTMCVSIASIPAIEPLLSFVGYEEDVQGFMTVYLQTRVFAVGAIVATEALGNWYGGIGNTRLHMIAGIVSMVANIGLNWVLIYGHWGAPPLGVFGAALASVVASWLGLLVLVIFFASGFSIPEDSCKPRNLRLQEFLRMLRFGVPHGVSWFLEFSAFILFINVVVADLGTAVLAAMMVVININSVSFMPAFGLTSAGAILAAQAIGSKQLNEVKKVVGRTLGIALVWQCSVGLVYLLLPAPLMRWFTTPGAEGPSSVVEIGTTLLAISAAWQLFDALSMTLGEALRAAGDTAFILWARLVVAWLVFIPSAFIFVRYYDGGYRAAMFCVVGYLAVQGTLLAVRFQSGVWKKIDLTGDQSLVVQS